MKAPAEFADLAITSGPLATTRPPAPATTRTSWMWNGRFFEPPDPQPGMLELAHAFLRERDASRRGSGSDAWRRA